MRIRFDIALEDLIAFEEARIADSADVRKRQNGFRRFVTGYLLLAPVLLVAFSSMQAYWLPVLLISAALSALFYRAYPGMMRKRLRRGMHMMRDEGELGLSLGEAEWEVLETGLITRIAGLETKLTWAAIDRIETTPDYTYLHIDSIQTCILPHRRILSGDLSAFLTELNRQFPPRPSLFATPTLPSADPN